MNYSPARKFILVAIGMLLIVFFVFLAFRNSGEIKNKDIVSAMIKEIVSVSAQAETKPVPRRAGEDAADDPAIWVHPQYPDSSRIIGTDKKGGLAVYDLLGNELFYYPDGEMNNVDIRYGFPLGGRNIDIAAVTNRTAHSISLYQINLDGSLNKIAKRELTTRMSDTDVYGLCMYKSRATGKFYVFINSKKGEVEQWELFAENKLVDGKVVRTLKLESQVEGMVADDENSALFVGEEEKGIWKFNAEPEADNGMLIPQSTEDNNANIRYDLEGLAIYKLENGSGYLIASSQGNDTYAVFRRKAPHEYLGSFKITDGEDIDGTEGTDGLEATSHALGKYYPKGMLVVQDGSNITAGIRAPQNFKIVSWDSIAKKANFLDNP